MEPNEFIELTQKNKARRAVLIHIGEYFAVKSLLMSTSLYSHELEHCFYSLDNYYNLS